MEGSDDCTSACKGRAGDQKGAADYASQQLKVAELLIEHSPVTEQLCSIYAGVHGRGIDESDEAERQKDCTGRPKMRSIRHS